MGLLVVGLVAGLAFPEQSSAQPYRNQAAIRYRAERDKVAYALCRASLQRPQLRNAPPKLKSNIAILDDGDLSEALKRTYGLGRSQRRRLEPTVHEIVSYLKQSGRQGCATFDADGTLWAGDVGEGFFQWMLRQDLYPREKVPELRYAWGQYQRGVLPSEKMYELMVTGLAGLKEADVIRHAERYFDRHQLHRIYRPMASLVWALGDIGITPWVVSGSPQWVVAAGARRLGIPAERVIGLSVRVDADGRLTNELVEPVPWRMGKAHRILERLGAPPVFAAGNSFGDLQMLRIASGRPLIINPTQDVLRQALSSGWTIGNFSRSHELAPRPVPTSSGPDLPVGLLTGPTQDRPSP